MPTAAPTSADCLEALLRIASDDSLDDEQKREALSAIAASSSDPAKMQALLQPPESAVETEADRDLVEGPEEERESATYARNGELAAAIETAGKEADPNPSEEQKKAGNYRKGHVTVQGLPITIENARGSTRSGKGKGGKPWSVEMKHHYGYIKRTESEADGDHIDVFLGPYPESEIVFVVDQQHPGGRFDEHKCMIGFLSEMDAKQGYLDCYSPGWEGFGKMTPMTMTQFKQWIADGDTAKRATEATPTTYAATVPSALNVLPDSASTTAKKPEGETVDEVIVPDQPGAEEEDDEEEPDSLLELEDCPQEYDFDSGAACAMSVGRHFGVGPETLAEWREALGTSEELSTSPDKILDYLDDLGLEADCRDDMTLDDLTECWQKGQPVICFIDEYSDTLPPKAKYEYGHVVAVVGRKYGFVFLFDPMASTNQEPDSLDAPGLATVEEEDFLASWWHSAPRGGKWDQLGIVVGPKKKAKEESTADSGGSTDSPTLSPESLDRPEVKEAVETLLTQLGVSSEEMQPVIEQAKEILKEQEPPNPDAVGHPWKKQFLALADRAEKNGDKHSARIYRRQAAELK